MEGLTTDIITGDCLDVLPLLPARSVKLVCNSPPHPGQMGNGQSVGEWLCWLDHVARQLRPILAPSAVVALNVAFKRTAEGWQALEAEYQLVIVCWPDWPPGDGRNIQMTWGDDASDGYTA